MLSSKHFLKNGSGSDRDFKPSEYRTQAKMEDLDRVQFRPASHPSDSVLLSEINQCTNTFVQSLFL